MKYPNDAFDSFEHEVSQWGEPYMPRVYWRRFKRLWKIFQAFFRLDPGAVCEMSEGKGHIDYHDYPDDIDGFPWHFFELTCKRCGKKFTI